VGDFFTIENYLKYKASEKLWSTVAVRHNLRMRSFVQTTEKMGRGPLRCAFFW
jgi:hypothetical protein